MKQDISEELLNNFVEGAAYNFDYGISSLSLSDDNQLLLFSN